jgi:hypothetical protein
MEHACSLHSGKIQRIQLGSNLAVTLESWEQALVGTKNVLGLSAPITLSRTLRIWFSTIFKRRPGLQLSFLAPSTATISQGVTTRRLPYVHHFSPLHPSNFLRFICHH